MTRRWEKALAIALEQVQLALDEVRRIRNPIERDKAATELIDQLENTAMVSASEIRGEVILSFVADGLPHTDIAKLLGISPARVGQLKAAALRRRASRAILNALE